MRKFIEELHNHEDASNLRDSIALFFGGAVVLVLLGSIFWSAF